MKQVRIKLLFIITRNFTRGSYIKEVELNTHMHTHTHTLPRHWGGDRFLGINTTCNLPRLWR